MVREVASAELAIRTVERPFAAGETDTSGFSTPRPSAIDLTPFAACWMRVGARKRRMYTNRLILTATVALLRASVASAQYSADFEPAAFSGSAAGIPLAGQDGFFLPVGSQVDGECYSYSGNELGLVPNPIGATQFIAVRRASSDFARTQRPISLESANCWFIDFDLNVAFNGTLPTANYAGSISLQPYPDDGSVVVLFYWDNVNTAETFNIRILGFDAAGGIPFIGGLPIPAAGFSDLEANRWYRLSIRVEFLAANAVTGLAIHPVEGGPVASFVPFDLNGFHLGGGLDATQRPIGFRLFGGGGSAGDHYTGNIVALDNLNIVPTTDVPCYADLDLNGVIDLQDLALLLASFGITDTATYLDGDLDCDRDVDLDDLALMLSQFGIACV